MAGKRPRAAQSDGAAGADDAERAHHRRGSSRRRAHRRGAVRGRRDATLEEARRAFEREWLVAKLREHGWNVSRTAEAVGLARESLSRKIRALKIETQRAMTGRAPRRIHSRAPFPATPPRSPCWRATPRCPAGRSSRCALPSRIRMPSRSSRARERRAARLRPRASRRGRSRDLAGRGRGRRASPRRGIGAGRAVLADAERARAATAHLEVRASNTAAIALYERLRLRRGRSPAALLRRDGGRRVDESPARFGRRVSADRCAAAAHRREVRENRPEGGSEYPPAPRRRRVGRAPSRVGS